MHPGFVPTNHPNAVKKRGVDDSIDDRETPDCVYVPLHEEFHFSLDAAAAHHNAKCPLYATLGGLYANIAGRVVTVHEEDETRGAVSHLDWIQTTEGVWALCPPPKSPPEALACPSHHLRLGSRRYTAWDDGVSPLRQPRVCEPAPSVPGDGVGQHEGLREEGQVGRTLHEGAQAHDALEIETRSRRTGLGISWAGHRVYINPPFSSLAPWVEKAWRDPAELVCMLLPNNRQEQPFWQDMIEPFRDRPGSILTTRFLRRRRPFLHRGEGIGNRTSKNPPFGLVVCIWDRRCKLQPGDAR